MEIQELLQGAGRPEWLMLVCIAIALLNCFFGYRLLKFWISFTGFLIGGTAGYLIVNQYVNNVAYAILAGFLLGLLIGFLAWRFYLAGVFFMVLIMIFSLFLRVTPQERLYQILILAAGLLVSAAGAVAAVRLVRPAVILASAISGGFSAAADLAEFLKLQELYLPLIVGVLLAAAGAGIQFLTTRDRGKGLNNYRRCLEDGCFENIGSG